MLVEQIRQRCHPPHWLSDLADGTSQAIEAIIQKRVLAIRNDIVKDTFRDVVQGMPTAIVVEGASVFVQIHSGPIGERPRIWLGEPLCREAASRVFPRCAEPDAELMVEFLSQFSYLRDSHCSGFDDFSRPESLWSELQNFYPGLLDAHKVHTVSERGVEITHDTDMLRDYYVIYHDGAGDVLAMDGQGSIAWRLHDVERTVILSWPLRKILEEYRTCHRDNLYFASYHFFDRNGLSWVYG